jgi:hypothetical protein
MRKSVHLDDQLMLAAQKIGVEWADLHLATELRA